MKSDDFEMQYDKNTWNTWGTQIVKFHDKFGYSWILELDVRKIDNDWNPVMGQIKNHKSVNPKAINLLYEKQRKENNWK